MTGGVLERDERLAAVESAALQVPLDGQITARVVVVRNESPEDLRGGVALLGWRGPIVRENVVNDTSYGIEDGGGARLGECVGLGLRVAQRLENGCGRVTETLGQFANGRAIPTGLPDLSKIVHREHPPPPALTNRSGAGTVLRCFCFR